MNETEFAYRIRQALNEGAERLDYKTTFRLEQARVRALTGQRTGQEATVWIRSLATSGGAPLPEAGVWTWLRRAGLVAPVAALLIGFVAIYQWQHAQTIQNLADLDFAVLLDDNPIDTFAEPGFGVLMRNQNSAN
jgi:hypothetical protein